MLKVEFSKPEDREDANISLLPGIAGQAGAEHRVPDGNGNKMLMKPSVHPTLWHDVVSVAYGTS